MMKKIFLALLRIFFVILIIILGFRLFSGEDNWICQNGVWIKHGKPAGPMPTGTCQNGQQVFPQKTPAEVAIPNPASKNCEDKGGKTIFLNETAGQLGICVFSDGSQCEEWQFYRGECKKGQLTSADTSHAYSGVITKTNNRFSFKDSSGTTYTLEIPMDVSVELKERLFIEVFNKGIVTIVAAETPPLSKNLILKNFQGK